MAEDKFFDLYHLVSGQGYECLVENIFSNLDQVTLAKCRLVSRDWKDLIDNRRSLLVIQLQSLKLLKLEFPQNVRKPEKWHELRKISVIDVFPEFKSVFEDLERNANESELKIVVIAMRNYSKSGSFPCEILGNCFPTVHDTRNLFSIIFPRTPLHQAIKNGDIDFIKILMKLTIFDFQSPIQYDDLTLKTYLTLAVHNQAIVDLFLDYALKKGINLNIPDGGRQTAFHYACMHGSLDVVKLFVEKIPKEFLNVNQLNEEGLSPLHLACYGNKPETVSYLLELPNHLGLNLNVRDISWWTPLHLASAFGHYQVVEVLLEASLQKEMVVDGETLHGLTPFKLACINGHFDVAKLMVDKCRIYQIDLNMNQAFHCAISQAELDLATMIIDKAKDQNVSLDPHGNYFIGKMLKIHSRIQSVFGRRSLMVACLLIFAWSLCFEFEFVYFVAMTFYVSFAILHLDYCHNQNFNDWLEILFRRTNQQCQASDTMKWTKEQMQSSFKITVVAKITESLFIYSIVILVLLIIVSRSKDHWKYWHSKVNTVNTYSTQSNKRLYTLMFFALSTIVQCIHFY